MSKHLDEMANKTQMLSALMDDKGENGQDLLEAMDSLLISADELFKSASPENPKNNEVCVMLSTFSLIISLNRPEPILFQMLQMLEKIPMEFLKYLALERKMRRKGNC